MKLPIFVYLISTYFPTQEQLNYSTLKFEKKTIFKEEALKIAYKLPFRGENYRFFGTIRYHVLGTAYTSNYVHNTIIESFKISETNCADVNFKILKCTNRKMGLLRSSIEQKKGFNVILMTPLLRNKKALYFYNTTGLFRFFIKYNKDGISKFNKKYAIDFESMAQYIINLDDASKQYGLKIKRVIFDKRFLKKLYKTKSGQELKKRNIYFAKYLSKKVNRKYDDLFYVEFEIINQCRLVKKFYN